MTVEMIGEKEYLEAISSNQELWVLMRDQQVYLVKSETGNAIATWHRKENAEEFNEQANLEMLAVSIPIHLFKGTWLKSPQYGITEIIASPRYGFPGLTFTKTELLNA